MTQNAQIWRYFEGIKQGVIKGKKHTVCEERRSLWQRQKKLPSGSWNVVVFAGFDKDGKKIRKSFTAPTKNEFKAKHKEIMRDKSAMTLSEGIDKFIVAIPKLCSVFSYKQYVQICTKNFVYCFK